MARRDDDRLLRERTAAEWSAMYDAEIEPAQIDCDGCLPGVEVHFAHCRDCDIRACALKRGLRSCADCAEYSCRMLEGFFGWVPEARETLDSLREGAGQDG
jgi:hypothetical protein